MYKIVSERRAWWPVIWTAAAEDDPGYVIENRIEMRFRLLDVDAAQDLLRRSTEMAGTISADTSLSDAITPIVMEFASDWRGVCAENGEPLAWSAETVRKLLNVPGVFQAVMDGFRAALGGQGEVRAGN